jgi:hypothetical protein
MPRLTPGESRAFSFAPGEGREFLLQGVADPGGVLFVMVRRAHCARYLISTFGTMPQFFNN